MSIANTIGRSIGYAAAASVHGACVVASSTGQFGKDMATGTKEGYVDHSARLAALRATRTALPAASIAMAVTPAPKRARPHAHA